MVLVEAGWMDSRARCQQLGPQSAFLQLKEPGKHSDCGQRLTGRQLLGVREGVENVLRDTVVDTGVALASSATKRQEEEHKQTFTQLERHSLKLCRGHRKVSELPYAESATAAKKTYRYGPIFLLVSR